MLAASLAAPAAVMAGPFGFNVHVVAPNHVNDTADLQAALNACVGGGPGCTVQLLPGTYYTSQLLTYNFHGTFTGAGDGLTKIDALPLTNVNWPDPYVTHCMPNFSTCIWPDLIMFVGGSIEVSDLSIDLSTYTNGAETSQWTLNGEPTALVGDVLLFWVQGRTDALVDHVSITGADDTESPVTNGYTGYNVVNGVTYITNPNLTATTPMTGSFAVRNSSFQTMLEGVQVLGDFRSVPITVGGSPGAGNRIDDVVNGIIVGGPGATYDVSADDATTNPNYANAHIGVFVEPSGFETASTPLSQVLIHDNNIESSDALGSFVYGLLLLDASTWQLPPSEPAVAVYWFRGTILHNAISLPKPAWLYLFKDGIDVNNASGLLISGNTINDTGSTVGAADAIALWGDVTGSPPSTNNVVIGNNVSGFTPDPTYGFAQYYLDPITSHNLVVCTTPKDTALDQGMYNTVIGCSAPTAATPGVTPLVRPTSPANRFKLPLRVP